MQVFSNKFQTREVGRQLFVYAYRNFENKDAVKAMFSKVEEKIDGDSFLLRSIRGQFFEIDRINANSTKFIFLQMFCDLVNRSLMLAWKV